MKKLFLSLLSLFVSSFSQAATPNGQDPLLMLASVAADVAAASPLLALARSSHASAKTTHQCLTCGRIYNFPSELKIHTRIHTGERPFKCNFPNCGKAFTQSNNLQTHKKTHSKEKEFKCEKKECSQSFTQKSHLTRHTMEQHSSEEGPFKCPLCQKGFFRSERLQAHISAHSGNKKNHLSQETEADDVVFIS